MIRSKFLRHHSPLARKATLWTVIFSSILTLILTSWHLYHDYKLDLNSIDSNLDLIQRVHLESIAASLWATNQDQLDLELDGILRLRDMHYASVKEGDHIWAEAGQLTSTNIVKREFPIVRVHRGERRTIGVLSVVATLDGVYERLLESALIIFGSNAVKTFFVAGFMLFLFQRLVTRHVHQLANQVSNTRTDEKIQLTGRPNKTTERDELDELVIALNQMRQRIAQHHADLEGRVSERTAQLEATNKELESFCYAVSHDLRTPLRAMDGFSRVLEEDVGPRLSNIERNYLQRIRSASHRMGQLIDDLLRLSRLTRTELEYKSVNLSGLVEDIIAPLKTSDPTRSAEFDLSSNLQVQGDEGLLRTALENLLGNAWKYTSKRTHTQIKFGADQSTGETVYYVKDNGAGFDMRYAGKLFGAFQRLHDAREFQGTGIGLATTQRIIARHGGRIWAEAHPDAGANFYFTLGTHNTISQPQRNSTEPTEKPLP